MKKLIIILTFISFALSTFFSLRAAAEDRSISLEINDSLSDEFSRRLQLNSSNQTQDTVMNTENQVPETPTNQSLSHENTYCSEDEYKKHLDVFKKFFNKKTRNESARKEIYKFKEDPNYTICLDGYSSRTRVLMFQELISLKYIEYKNSPCYGVCIKFNFNKKNFSFKLKPTKHQPGNAFVDSIGTYSQIFDVLSDHQPKLVELFSLLRDARSKTTHHTKYELDYNGPMENPILYHKKCWLDLEMLNILLDYETARHLVALHINEDKKQFYEIMPVSISVITMFEQTDRSENGTDIISLENFFCAENNNHNPFKGEPDERKEILKKHIQRYRGLQKETIHKKHLKYYGGESESEGESYNDN